jgi:hypothetical protein
MAQKRPSIQKNQMSNMWSHENKLPSPVILLADELLDELFIILDAQI